MGWVKGFGLSMLRDIILATAPTHLFTLCTGNPRKDVTANSPWMHEGVC
jgi:polynucleotide 5'-kinase involved in rRNA processing